LKETPRVDLGDGVMGYDIPKVSEAIMQGGGDPKPIVERLGPINQSLQQMHTARMNSVKLTAQAVHDAGNDPDLAQSALDTFEQNGVITAAQAAPLRAMATTPEGVAKMTAYFLGAPKVERAVPGSMAIGPDQKPIEGTQVPALDKPEKLPEGFTLAPGATRYDATGQPIASAPAIEPKPPRIAIGSFEDYVGRKYGANPTPAQIEAARRTYSAADNAPAKPEKAVDVTPDIQTTMSGHTFVDLSLYGAGERDAARVAASRAGAIPVSKEVASSLQDLDTTRQNQQKILSQIEDLVPKNAAGRIIAAPVIKLEKVFQTDEQVAAFNTWRTSAIQAMRATAGSKGLRINRSEIDMAIQNDIPKLTDTWATAQQKVKNVLAMLDSIENSALVRDRSSLVPDRPIIGPPAPASAPPGIQGLRNR
jgi:hypothetical protein